MTHKRTTEYLDKVIPTLEEEGNRRPAILLDLDSEPLSKGGFRLSSQPGWAVFWPDDPNIPDNSLSQATELRVSQSESYLVELCRRCTPGSDHFDCKIREFLETLP